MTRRSSPWGEDDPLVYPSTKGIMPTNVYPLHYGNNVIVATGEK